jgi:oligopeptidase A
MANPFISQDFYIRWSALSPSGVEPAVDLALTRAQAAIDAIAMPGEREATFENTFLALEQATEELNVTWAKITHLQSVADSPSLREAHNRVLPRVSGFFARITLNAPLWARLKSFAESAAAASLSGIRRRLVDETVRDFREAGADLPAEKRVRLEGLQKELAQLTQKYAENVLDATNAWQLLIAPAEEIRLAGLPDHAKAAAARSAEAKGLTGWRFTLHQPSLEPLLTYAEDAALRREAWSASAAVGTREPQDNTSLITRILVLRAEKASLLGHRDFADCVLQRRMAQCGQRALDFVEDFQRRCATGFARECRELEEFKASHTGKPSSPLAPWDITFWAEKLRRARYDFDDEVLRPYFPLPRVIAGLFELAHRLFGLRITERAAGTIDVWHPDVGLYDMHDARGRHLGSFYSDWHPREAKRGGAWMNTLITGGPQGDGRRRPHLGLICGNLTPPAGDKPALLTHREVETVFHEFGHLLHHLLGEVEFKSLNGVNVAWDFVELPSQIMENWTWERDGLDLIACHHVTGATVPDAIFQSMLAARNFRAACATMRQVAFAKLDLLIHQHSTEFAAAADIEPLARAAIGDCLVPTEPPMPTIVKRFTHIFADPVGYAAGYYSYKWAEVLDADAFSRFKREGIFNAAVGAEFAHKILSRGNSAAPASLFRDFMGRDPDPTALLARAGLLAATSHTETS